jgi:hypothetical protein
MKKSATLLAALAVAFAVHGATRTASEAFVTNKLECIKYKSAGELISCAWTNAVSGGRRLEQQQRDTGETFWASYGNYYTVHELMYDGKWLYRTYRTRLGGGPPDWQYTNTASKAATELVFGSLTLTRCDEVWGGDGSGPNRYPLVYADELAAAADAATNYTNRAIAEIDIPDFPPIPDWALQPTKPTYSAVEVGATTPEDVTNAIREQSLGGIWDQELEVWWTPVMRNGTLTYQATTNVNLNAEANP